MTRPGDAARPRLSKLALALAPALALTATPLHAQVDYARAERFLSWNLTPLILHGPVMARWMDGRHFWYATQTAEGRSFLLVDAAAGTRRPVFDNARLAAALSLAGDTAYRPDRLPFDDFRFAGRDTIDLRAGRRAFRCALDTYRCSSRDTLHDLPASHVRSPDGRLEAFVHEYNLYVRPAGGGDSTRLTNDGVRYWAYGLSEPRATQQQRPSPRRPVLQWSPDSRRIAVQRTDERAVSRVALYSVTGTRPRTFEFPYALPGDSVIPVYDIHIVEVDGSGNTRVDAEPQTQQTNGVSNVGQDSTWVTVRWSADSRRLYFTHALRGPKRIALMEAEAATGEARRMVADSAGSFVELNLDNGSPPNWRVANAGQDVIWFSERDGWGHLYRFDGHGRLKNRVTSGAWTVASIHHVDERGQRVYFTARAREPGRDPYLAHLYRVGFDGTGLELLTPEAADHRISFSPEGRFFVDVYSTVDSPPVSVLRALDGRVLRTLERADLAALEAIQFRPGEPFTVKARDGVTDLYGVMYRPSTFDPAKKYPVIDHIYPGPQIIASPKRFYPSDEPTPTYASAGQVQALAELGFIVLHIDAMGTPYRSKAFLDTWYGNMADNGIPDHVLAIKQLGARYGFMDLERVGIYGHSGGGFASTSALLRYPDFFKVAVSTSGNHDNRTYQYHWGEKYQGLFERDTLRGSDNYESQANFLLAENLRGKLLLMHGDLDDNVLPAMTLRVVDALIKANKTFDLVILPDLAHNVIAEPYVIRRTWDYFVTHLLGETPPADYPLAGPPR